MASDATARGMAANSLVKAKQYADTKVSAIGSGFSYKGSVATVQDLPASATKGDTYNIQTGGTYAWDGSAWYPVTLKGETGATGATGPQGPAGQDGKVKDVTFNGTSVLDANDEAALPRDLSQYDNTTSDFATSSDIPEVINAVNNTSTTKALSANMGKELQDQVNNLKNIGRFLAIWDSSTGLPLTNPTTMPYTYKTGDYFRVGTVGTTTNYKPNGSSYSGSASTTVETESVEVGWVYYYDGTQWLAQSAGGGGTVQDVQINGTSIIDSGTGVANIPNSSSSASGVMTSAQFTKLDGVEANADVTDATNVENAGAIMKTEQTLSSAEKTQARTNIEAIALEEYNSSASSYSDGVLYYVVD